MENMLIIGRMRKAANKQGHLHLLSGTFRVSSEVKEICASTLSGNRISGSHSKFCESYSLTALTLGAEGPGGVRKDVQQELDIDFGIDLTFRSLVINHPSSCTSLLTNSESSTFTDITPEIEDTVSNGCRIGSLSERETALVDVELTTFQWGALRPESSRPAVDSDRCFKKGMGSNIQGCSNWGIVVQGKTSASYQCLRTSSNKISLLTFIKSGSIRSIHFQIENKTAISYLLKTGGAQQTITAFVEKEHNYFSRIPSQCSKNESRLEVTKQQRLLRLKTVSSNLSKNYIFGLVIPR